MPSRTHPWSTYWPGEEEAVKISSHPLQADKSADGREQTKDLSNLSLSFHKGAFGGLKGCWAFPTWFAFLLLQLTFDSHSMVWMIATVHTSVDQPEMMVNS